MNVLFLDFDGVINTYWWNADGTKFEIGYKNKCTNFQAVQWISHFCEKHNYYIVVSSTWRIGVCLDRLKNILTNSGMSENVANARLIGKTPFYNHDHVTRGEEINDWLIKHPDVNRYIIVDDDDDFEQFPEMRDHLVKTNFYVGFTMNDFATAEELHKKLKGEMCKYANTGVVKVSTPNQVKIIAQVMNTKTAAPKNQSQRGTTKTQFNANLWGSNKKQGELNNED